MFSPHPSIRILQIIHLALIAGVLFFAVIAFTISSGIEATGENDFIFFVVTFFFAVIMTSIAFFVPNYFLKNISRQTPLQTKLNIYRLLKIIQFASVEAPAILAICFYLITGNFYFFLITLFLLIIMYSLRPSLFDFENKMPLTREEKEEL